MKNTDKVYNLSSTQPKHQRQGSHGNLNQNRGNINAYQRNSTNNYQGMNIQPNNNSNNNAGLNFNNTEFSILDQTETNNSNTNVDEAKQILDKYKY